ncbi:MAG: PQQ-like beta-propeller repeat protein [Rickettsiales bacterium]|jgi:outer membrane protein assembly factor BamB|nr:PQQ-like beta-propeller repeat protein [Rickettsiales bacterium]
MKKIISVLLVMIAVSACSSSDPILPGARTPVFDSVGVETIGDIPMSEFANAKIITPEITDKFVQTLDNEVFEKKDGNPDRKIFAGFATNEKIDTPRYPVFYKNFVYAALTTGEVAKINPRNRQILWIADVYKNSNMLGGSRLVDITAMPIANNNLLFVGGLGGEFCALNIQNGNKKWCANLSTDKNFVLLNDIVFVNSVDKILYALNAKNGKIYWTANTKKSATPKVINDNGNYFVMVDDEKFNAINGK